MLFRQFKDFSLSTKFIPDFWYSLRNIKNGMENTNFGIPSDFMTKLTVLSHSSASVKIIFSLLINKLKQTL